MIRDVLKIGLLVSILVLLGLIYDQQRYTNSILWLQLTLMDDTTYEDFEVKDETPKVENYMELDFSRPSCNLHSRSSVRREGL